MKLRFPPFSPSRQFLRDVAENFWKEHLSVEILLHEYRRKLDDDNVTLCRSPDYEHHDIHLISLSREKRKNIIANVDKYNALADRWEHFRNFKLTPDRNYFGCTFFEKKALIFGRMVAGNYVKTVRSLIP